MARKKVYVSSTFKDLEEHRSAVKATLERAGFDVECGTPASVVYAPCRWRRLNRFAHPP